MMMRKKVRMFILQVLCNFLSLPFDHHHPRNHKLLNHILTTSRNGSRSIFEPNLRSSCTEKWGRFSQESATCHTLEVFAFKITINRSIPIRAPDYYFKAYEILIGRTLFLWQKFGQNHFGHQNRLKTHIRWLKWVKDIMEASITKLTFYHIRSFDSKKHLICTVVNR